VRVVVAMSGGVDSAVAAGLLAEAGHEVIGVTLQLYDHGAATGRKGACCAGQDIHDAKRAADHLGIPHYTIDAEARFRDAVMADFADSYASGETPVPCVRCNQSVKFTDLTALARGLGAERLATGHYVRRIEGDTGPELHRAVDAARDQSWFLFATTTEQLAFSLFPLGGMAEKRAVRAEAARLGLAVAGKPESQDICFVPSGGYETVVAKLRPDAMAPGEIVDGAGRVLGSHAGVAGFTVGQRKRLGNLAPDLAVTSIDAASRRIVVGRRDEGAREVALREVNWLIAPPEAPLRCEVKLRGRDRLRPASIWAVGAGEASVLLDEAALAAPGQACVFYRDTRILGGGFITRPA
jgi:tRNA-specific 2-thiouridylase